MIHIRAVSLYFADEPVVKKPAKDLKLVNLMPYVKELSSEGTVIAGWLDRAKDWGQIQQRSEKSDTQVVKLLLSWLQSTESEEYSRMFRNNYLPWSGCALLLYNTYHLLLFLYCMPSIYNIHSMIHIERLM